MRYSTMKSVLSGSLALITAVSLCACGSGQSGNAKSDHILTFWDPYPQYTSGAKWDTHVKKCAPKGYTIKRQGMPQNDVLNNLTTAVKANNSPDIAVLDNPFMPTAVDSGLVTDLGNSDVKVSGFDANIEGPGIVDGKQYGLAFGTNALGLYYNPTILKKAGVDPNSIVD